MHPDTRLLKARGGEAAEPRQQPPVCSCVALGRTRVKRFGGHVFIDPHGAFRNG